MLAPAKINLHLHITGRAENGYHLLDSLVAFTSLCDEIHIGPSDTFKLDLSGNTSLSASCTQQDNLVSRAAYALAAHTGLAPHIHIELLKKIPLAGGLGGGSADAAATLRLLKEQWKIESDEILKTVAASLGSDIVACLYNKPVIMRETGNTLLPAPTLPKLYGLLANPNLPCPTPEVYKAYTQMQPPFSHNTIFPDKFDSAIELCAFLRENTRNDLTNAAISVAPPIKTVLQSLNQIPNCLLSRLSGSGATCFALFESAPHAREGLLQMRKDHPDIWADTWIEPVEINPFLPT